MIYLIRHGEAGYDAPSDAERQLTIRGRIELNEKFTEFVRDFKSENFKVYSSPLVRAIETSEILCEKLGCEFEIARELSGGDYTEFIKSLEKGKDYILVGHEPSISDAIYEFTNRYVNVSKGSIHKLDI